MNSNTTLVKVKYLNKNLPLDLNYIQIQHLLKLNYLMYILHIYNVYNSNTTLVKVKLSEGLLRKDE